jgi:DNA repair protein SbcC/Rad50
MRARTRLAALAQRAAQARFDDFVAAIALCHERESTSDSGRATGAKAADLEARWNALTNLPDAWKGVLEARFRGIGAGPTNALPAAPPRESAEANLLDALLNLEAACGIDSPSDFRVARQQLKMRALKSAMEARQSPADTPADIERWLLEAAAYPRPDEQSRDRLSRVIAALRLEPLN